MTDTIRLRDLTYRAGRDFALRRVNLTVPAGTIYGFLGPNGAGKTTTIRCLMGMLPPDEGSIEVLGHQVPRDVVGALARIGYVPERLHLYPTLQVDEMIRHHGAFFPRWDAAHAEQLRRRFDLRTDAKIGRLSKGEAGKLMMLLALASRPELLVLDEPTDGLDPVVRRDVLTAVVDYVGATGATVFISSHLVHEQERICQWVGVLDAGQMVAELPMEEFRAGIKRLRVQAGTTPVASTPFTVLARRPLFAADEEWVVSAWRADMRSWFDGATLQLRDVEDLDLEDSFVELLSAARTTTGEVA